jgi:SpoVK/Ycf46/Vps4 family AAA+-type ATPase
MVSQMNSKETNTFIPESELETTAPEAYNSGREHLMDELSKLDTLIQFQVLRLRTRYSHKKFDEFTGLYITEEEIDKVLENEPKTQDRRSPSTEDSERMVLLNQIESLQTRISERVEESIKCGIFLPLYQLAYLFHLTPFELDTILICLAPELDLKYETLYAYLQNDVTKKHPGVNLILDLLCNTQEQRIDARTYFYSQAPLLKYALLRFIGDTEQKPLLSRSLKLDGRIVDFLLGFNLLDSRLDSFAEIIKPERDWSAVIMDAALKERLSRLPQEHFKEGIGNKLIFYFHGPYGAGKKLVAEAFCQDLQLPLIIVDMRTLLNAEASVEKIIRLLFRETLLQPAAIYLRHFDRLLTDDSKDIHYQNIIIRAIEEFSLVTFLAGEKPWNPPASLKKQTFIKMEFPIPPYSLRKDLWELSLDGQYPLLSEVNTAILADKFRFTGGQIQDAVAEARNLSIMHQSNDNGRITMDDLYRSCRAQSNHKLSELAQKLIPHYTWDEIVLPMDKFQQLREICNYVKYRQLVYDNWGFKQKLSLGKGLNILFSGPSGTGKTMAADIIANELKLELYKIDLSCVVSKYIGETEKNLAKIFKEAETSNAILFFDEADALFGKRSEVKDSHDRYANIEINYLLQKMEEHEGIVILASNFRKNIDDAFTRRMHFTVDFPFPDEKYRLKIWQNIFPKETPKSEEIEFEFLAKQFKISGGNIKNIALHAAFLAAGNSKKVDMAHIIQGTKREYQKMGKLCVKSDFGKYFELVESEVKHE